MDITLLFIRTDVSRGTLILAMPIPEHSTPTLGLCTTAEASLPGFEPTNQPPFVFYTSLCVGSNSRRNPPKSR